MLNNLFRSRRWPAHILDTLEANYHLSPKDMSQLWYIRRKVAKGKYPIDVLLIYDWARACEKRISVRNSRDLHINSDLLRFKGNIFGNGSIHVERLNN